MFVRRVPKLIGEQSISKLTSITIGGVKQWIYIRGKNRTRPILLMLHGGPGTGQIGFIRPYQKELEEQFVVVQWDQRGTGLSYSKHIPLESMTIDQFVKDTVEVTKYVLHLLKQQQLYIIGHSWGTLIGILAIAHSPKLYQRYFGISQVANIRKSEQISYRKALVHAKKTNDEKEYKRLLKIGSPPWVSFKDAGVHQKYVEQIGGGITRSGKMTGQLVKGLLMSKEYTIFDVIRYFKGMHFSMKQLQAEMMRMNLEQEIKRVVIPIYFLMGKHDLITPSETTEQLFNQIKAPEKKWIWFNDSAHTPYLEEREKFINILSEEIKRDV